MTDPITALRADVDAVGKLLTDAAAQHTADVATIAGLEHTRDQLTSDKTALQVQVDHLLAELGQLRPATLTLGLDTTDFSPAGIAAQRKMLGGRPLRNVRVFFKPGADPVWTDHQFAALTPADTPFVSVKTISEKTLTAFLDTMPAAFKVPGAVYKFAIKHEYEADAYDSGDYKGAVAAYLAEQAMAQKLFAQHSNGNFFELWKIGLRYSQVLDSKRGLNKGSWKDFVGDQDIPYGMDCYWEKNFPNYDSPEVLFGKLLEVHAATGLRVGVPEWGGITVGGQRNDPDGSKRAAAITAGIAYLRTTPIEYASWWNGTGSAGNHCLEPYPSNAAAWAAGMAANPG